jgi:uncharacterized membrane protein (UPF0127 family)
MRNILDGWNTFQDRFSKRLIINNSPLSVEIAGDDESQSMGLKHRQSLGQNSGMLFVYRSPRLLSFWMKDTYIPLSIAFINQDGKIANIKHMKPRSEESISSDQPCKYALEVNHGWFDKNNISVGQYVRNLP